MRTYERGYDVTRFYGDAPTTDGVTFSDDNGTTMFSSCNFCGVGLEV